MNCRHCDVQSIDRCLLWYWAIRDQSLSEVFCVLSNVQQGNSSQLLKPPLRQRCISHACFLKNKLRYEEGKRGAAISPPLLSNLLMGRHNQISTWSGC